MADNQMNGAERTFAICSIAAAVVAVTVAVCITIYQIQATAPSAPVQTIRLKVEVEK